MSRWHVLLEFLVGAFFIGAILAAAVTAIEAWSNYGG